MLSKHFLAKHFSICSSKHCYIILATASNTCWQRKCRLSWQKLTKKVKKAYNESWNVLPSLTRWAALLILLSYASALITTTNLGIVKNETVSRDGDVCEWCIFCQSHSRSFVPNSRICRHWPLGSVFYSMLYRPIYSFIDNSDTSPLSLLEHDLKLPKILNRSQNCIWKTTRRLASDFGFKMCTSKC